MSTNTSERMSAYRRRLRERGLRPIQLWVPDTSAPGFREEALRQAKLISESPTEDEDLAFIEEVADWSE